MTTRRVERVGTATVRTGRVLYRRTALILWGGFLIASGLILLGMLLALVRGQELGAAAVEIGDLPGELRRLSARGVVSLGILALLASPLAHVLAAAFTFAQQRDWLYVGICVTLVAILVASVVVALI